MSPGDNKLAKNNHGLAFEDEGFDTFGKAGISNVLLMFMCS